MGAPFRRNTKKSTLAFFIPFQWLNELLVFMYRGDTACLLIYAHSTNAECNGQFGRLSNMLIGLLKFSDANDTNWNYAILKHICMYIPYIKTFYCPLFVVANKIRSYMWWNCLYLYLVYTHPFLSLCYI